MYDSALLTKTWYGVLMREKEQNVIPFKKANLHIHNDLPTQRGECCRLKKGIFIEKMLQEYFVAPRERKIGLLCFSQTGQIIPSGRR